MQYTITAMALAGFAAALPQDDHAYGGHSPAPASYPKNLPGNATGIVTPPAYYSSSAPAHYPTSSEASKCPDPGYTDYMGRYSCNPAHSYPEGQFCDLVDGCYFLRTEGPGVTAVPCTSTIEQYTTYCPTPTTITAHSTTYTVTSATTLTVCPGNCVYTTVSLPPPVYTTATVSQYTTVCPTPTTVYTHGQTYPVTQASQTVTVCPGGCTVTQPAMPSGSAYVCPAPGSTDSMGRYSCNPAHQYPAGQTCQQVDSCYFLIGSSGPAPSGTVPSKPAGNATFPSMPATYTGGAAIATAAPVALLALGALFL